LYHRIHAIACMLSSVKDSLHLVAGGQPAGATNAMLLCCAAEDSFLAF